MTFFPQLIAGPIVHHREMLPQFMGKQLARVNSTDLAVGITLFSSDCSKKLSWRTESQVRNTRV